MTTHPRRLTAFALVAGLASFAALGAATPAGPSLDRKPPGASPATTERPQTDPGVAGDGRARCTRRGVECCCRTIPVSTATPGDDKKDKEGKDEKKAGPEAKAKGDAARKALVEQRQALAKDGVWDCCIEPGCVFCQTAADGCPCEANLRKGSAVCPECWGGWQAGHGQVKGIDPSKVPLPSKDTLKKLYDMKAKSLEKSSGGPDKK
jgi:hypothetical protein